MLGFILFGLPVVAAIFGYKDSIVAKINGLFLKDFEPEMPVINSFDEEFKTVFKRHRWTPTYILSIVFVVIISIAFLVSPSKAGQSEARGWGGLFFAWGYLITRYFSAKSIVLTNKGFFLDRNFTEWSMVENIDFTLKGRMETSSQTIEITVKMLPNKLIVKPGLYPGRKRLRELFERIAVSKGIKVHVEERGF